MAPAAATLATCLLLLYLLPAHLYAEDAEKENSGAIVGAAADEDRHPVTSARLRRGGGGGGRRGKQFLNVFQIIRFANGPCDSGTRNGTCYTEAECDSRGGSNSGACAAGFGVCCIITVGCGASSSENCTYFDSSSPVAGTCNMEICPCGDNICQIRLDFDTFTIAGPSTISASVAKRIGKTGVLSGFPIGTAVAPKATISVTEQGNCLTDSFSVTNPDGPSPPTICGVNSGEHMYVEASECCNDLTFKLGNMGVGTSIPGRSWSIKATQYTCDYRNLAPQGCVQYFFGANVGDVRTYNYQSGNGRHLGSQDQQICVRRERGNCRICWTDANDADFAISGKQPAAIGQNIPNDGVCCSYGAPSALTKVNGFDCVHIPGALSQNANGVPVQSYLCGHNKGLPGVTRCSVTCPFNINFRSDEYEVTAGSALDSEAKSGQAANRGFQLIYFMDGNNCNPSNTANTIG